jgi:hypothetical protein
VGDAGENGGAVKLRIETLERTDDIEAPREVVANFPEILTQIPAARGRSRKAMGASAEGGR